jgi:hypothetical protein
MYHPVHSHGHDNALRPRIGKTENLKRLAQAALKNVPNSQHVIDKVFNQSLIQPELTPEPQPDLVMHTGFFDV